MYYSIVYTKMNTIFILLFIIIIVLTLFLANTNKNVTEGYRDNATDFADAARSSTDPSMTQKSIFQTDYDKTQTNPTYAQINYDAKTYDNSATIQPGTTLGPFTSDDNNNNNYDLQYHDDIQSQDVSGNWSKTLGNVIYNEPGSLRFGSSGYVPSYEESIFLSPVTGLRYNQPMYIESARDIGFCEFNKNSVEKIEEQCSKLDKNVCASTGCCVLLGGSKCVAGNKKGPALKSNYGDTFIRNKDKYYHKGKCYGNCTGSDKYKHDNSPDYNFSPTPTTSFSPTPTTSFSPTPTTSFIPTPTTSFIPTPTTSFIPTTPTTNPNILIGKIKIVYSYNPPSNIVPLILTINKIRLFYNSDTDIYSNNNIPIKTIFTDNPANPDISSLITNNYKQYTIPPNTTIELDLLNPLPLNSDINLSITIVDEYTQAFSDIKILKIGTDNSLLNTPINDITGRRSAMGFIVTYKL